LTDFSIIELARRCPKLQYLEISWGGYITDKFIYKIPRSCYSLRHLGINGCITDKSIREITRSNPNIQSLNFNDCRMLTDAIIHALVGSYSDLGKLNLSDCNKVTDIGIRQIAQCHNLEHLAFKSLEFLNNETICIVVQLCPNICYLSLEFCYVTDTAVEAIANLCRNMECLNLYGLLTDMTIKNIAHHLSGLKYLGLKHCVNVSKGALDALDPDLEIGGSMRRLTKMNVTRNLLSCFIRYKKFIVRTA
ncbi:hypothetical protein G9A89_003649, partial [Geosiphon pyriformis]